MSSSFTPGQNHSPGSSRLLQLGVAGSASRLRSSSSKKPPEPLRRAVADCLSSSHPPATSHHGAIPSIAPSEALRNLRDYLSATGTTDLAYNMLLEHTIAERDRSPAVVTRCVALLKRYLLRYKPGEETLLQVDKFCVNLIAECDASLKQKSLPVLSAPAGASPLPVSSFASAALVKSLHYVRSLVALHIPRRSFQPAAFAGATLASRQLLPSLSSLLSKSFNSQLSPANAVESPQKKDAANLSVSNLSNIEEFNAMEDTEYISSDLLNWRWVGELQFSSASSESERPVNLQDMNNCNLLEVGAAGLLVGDMEAKMKGQHWKYFGTAEMPYLEQLLQPASVTMITNSASARSHLRAITASKRTRTGPQQIWDDSTVSTFRPRARPLFQYRHYSEQQPLRLNPAEVGEVIAAVCSEASSTPSNPMTVSPQLNSKTGKPSMDVAVSVLIKLVIDMYVLDARIAAPLTLSMLEEMLCSTNAACRIRVFDLILNLGVHAQLLEPKINDNATTIEEEYAQETFIDNENKMLLQGTRTKDLPKMSSTSSAIENFESWILKILFEILLLLVQVEEKEESVWASALSCLLYFVCDRGKIRRNQLNGLDIRVIKALLGTSKRNSWSEVVHSKLICIMTNMFYRSPELDGSAKATSRASNFLVEQVDLIGGVEFIFYKYSLATTREERRNLYSVLFDYVLHQINEACSVAGLSEYTDDEIQPLAVRLALADAPEAFYISVKLGVEGIGEILRRSIAAALSGFSNSERLNQLLANITEKFDTIIRSFTHLDIEFRHLKQLTKSHKFMDSIQELRNDIRMPVNLAWATLHSLLHSERATYRQNGYIWLGDLLIAEISEEGGGSIWLNIKDLQQKIALCGASDSLITSDIPISIQLLCGLLKSRNSVIRWGEKGIKKDRLLIFFFLLGLALLCFSPLHNILSLFFFFIFYLSLLCKSHCSRRCVRFSDLRLFKTLGGVSRKRCFPLRFNSAINQEKYTKATMEEESSNVTSSSPSTPVQRLRHRKRSSTEVLDGDKVNASPLLVNDRNKYKSFMIRTYSTLWMIAGFVMVVYMGHLYITAMVLVIQIFMAKELFNLLRKAPEDKCLPGIKQLNWHFFFTAMLFVYGRILSQRLANTVTADQFLYRLVTGLIKYHMAICYFLYIIGFMWFILTLKKKMYKYQFGQYAWTHMILIVVFTQSSFTVANIFEGIFWFLLPASLIIINDIFAYIFGFFFGRTPLIKLSPKKTWEGFIGASVTTIISAFVLANVLGRFPWLTCPRQDLSTGWLQCDADPLFKPEPFTLPAWIPGWFPWKEMEVLPVQWHALCLGLFASIIAPFGGFFASGFKRAFKIKDFGDSIPGHGGITDRMDCQMVMAVFAYIYLQSFIVSQSVSVDKILDQILTNLSFEEQQALFSRLGQMIGNS